MSKDLTPLQALKRIKSHYNDKVCIDILEDFDLIETALKRLEKNDNTRLIIVGNPSPDESVVEKTYKQGMFISNLEQCEIKPLFEEETEKKLKALEIINNKQVDMKELLGFFEWGEGFSYYNEYRRKEEKLTQEEYKILKEVLEK